MHTELQRRLLARAAEIVGGKAELCRRLGIDHHALEFWLSGRASPPPDALLAAADLILEDDIARASQDRRKAARDSAQAPQLGVSRPARQ